ncbi:transposase [Escherichia coli]|nr:transposase [Escherichia coli]
MKSLTAVRKKSPNYPVEFKIKMVELSHRPEISVAQLAREHGINDNLLFKWRQYWREGKLRPPSTTENNVPELLPITLDAEDVVPTTSPRSQPVAAATIPNHLTSAVADVPVMQINSSDRRYQRKYPEPAGAQTLIPLPSGTKIWLVAGITDMRNGFNSLAAKVQTTLKDDPMSGHVFIFRGRNGSQQ